MHGFDGNVDYDPTYRVFESRVVSFHNLSACLADKAIFKYPFEFGRHVLELDWDIFLVLEKELDVLSRRWETM